MGKAKDFERACADPKTTDSDALKARQHAANAGANVSQSQTAKDAKIKNPLGKGEYKTDIVFGNHTVSVKMGGAVQLSSAEGKTSANMLREVGESFSDLERASLDEPRLRRLIESVENMPVKTIAVKDIQKALARKPTISKKMLIAGKIRPEYNWDIYNDAVRPIIDEEIKDYLDGHPVFKHRFVEEALTGRYTMGHDSPAAASHVLTPYYYKPIDDNYISNVANDPSFRVRISAKSRAGITSSTLRIDYKVKNNA